MEFVKVMEIRDRMCGTNRSKQGCFRCGMDINNNGTGLPCVKFLREYPQKAEEILIKWDKENPVKTYKEDFIERFPNTKIKDIIPAHICIKDIYGIEFDCRGLKWDNCWNTELGKIPTK